MNYMIDLDGTIYRGNQPIRHAKAFIAYLNNNNQNYLLLTNCPKSSPEQIVRKLACMDIAVCEEQILTSGQVTVDYLQKHYLDQPVYAIGSDSFMSMCREGGIQLTEEDAACVVVAYDEQFTYDKMKKAVQMISAGAVLIATNGDTTIPHGNTIVPHTGGTDPSTSSACIISSNK